MTDPEMPPNEPVSPEPPAPEYEPGRAPDEAPLIDPTPNPPGDGRPYDAMARPLLVNPD